MPPVDEAKPRRLFVGVGATKSGTTWLAERLSRHPDIAMSPIKELHWFDAEPQRLYFDRQFARRAEEPLRRIAAGQAISSEGAAVLRRLGIRDDADYLTYLLGWCEPHHRSFGEFTPSYSLLDADGFRRILAVYPDTSLLYIMRNPADRFWSQIKFRERQGHPAFVDLADIDLSDGRLAGARARGDYVTTLDNMAEAAPGDRVFTAFFEDLFDPVLHEAELARLWGFLAVAHERTELSDLSRRVNPTPCSELSDHDRSRVVRMLVQTYRGVAERLGQIPKSWREDLDRYT